MKIIKKMSKVLLITIVCFSVLTGCAGGKNKNGSMKSDDGRSYGGTIEGEMKDTLETAFFDWKVESAEKFDTYQFDDGLYQAEEGMTYLVVELQIKNTYEKDLPMSITDFALDYDGNKEKEVITGYGKAELQNDEFMDNLFTLKKGESITRKILFNVKNKKAYSINYSEYYEDEFKGDSFRVNLVPEKKGKQTEKETK